MKVRFISTRQVSYNGYSVNTYRAGEQYESTHGREEGYFKDMVLNKHAELVKEKKKVAPSDNPVKKLQKKVKKPSRIK